MKKFTLMFVLLLLNGCGADAKPADDGVPVACRQHTARQFHFGEITCTPGVSETCGFGVHNQPVPLDQSGDALAYYCTCADPGQYFCWGSPSLAAADPLPND